MDKITQKYTNPSQPGSFSGLESFYRALTQNEKKAIPKSKIKKWLQGQESYTFHYPRKSRFKRNQIIVGGIDKTWQADLADFQNVSKDNDGFRYVLVVIDVFSKFVWVELLKNKTAQIVLDAFSNVLIKSNRKPKQLQSDDGKEFVNHKLKKFLDSNDINFYTVKSENKACIVERVIRTLKEKIYRYFTYTKSKKYIDIIDDIVSSYNATYHRTIKMAPNQVNFSNEQNIWEKVYIFNNNKPLKFNFKVGDQVRLSKVKEVFSKGYVKKWTREIFIITKQVPRYPPVYKVKDLKSEEIEGVFYEEEIQKIEL